MTERRGGFTAVEALLALLLMLCVLQAGWTLSGGMARSAVAVADRAESLAAARATGWILQEELEGARAGVDVSTPAGDSIALRAFRGTAIVCRVVSAREVTVGWTGLRAPDPVKDSALVLLGSGDWLRRGLQSRAAASGACRPRAVGASERWTLSDSVPGAVLLRVFERGSYHLSDDALRYRIGLGGRQPLTPATLDPARSGITRAGRGRVVLIVSTRGSHRLRAGPDWQRSFPLAGGW